MKERVLLLVLLLLSLFGKGIQGLSHHHLGEVQLETQSASILAGIYQIDILSLHFTSQSGAVNMTSNDGIVQFKFVDYGSFMSVQLMNREFLMSTDAAHVIDITSKNTVLPPSDPSITTNLDTNLQFFSDLISRYSSEELQSAKSDLISQMQEFINSKTGESLVSLSLLLASKGISGTTYPSSLPIHMPALNIAKIRHDIKIDTKLINKLNGIHYNNPQVEGYGCDLSDTCDNTCFGMCGAECSCWSWVCGTCDCYVGCWQHDCCCSCNGWTSLCCVNIATFRCAGYNNSCQPSL